MNTTVLKNQYNGFKLNDTLASNLKFSGIIRVWEVDHCQKDKPNGDILDFWVIKDEFGARLSTFDRHLAEGLHVSERYAVKGEIKIGKGGTYLNLKDAEPMNGSEYQEEN